MSEAGAWLVGDPQAVLLCVDLPPLPQTLTHIFGSVLGSGHIPECPAWGTQNCSLSKGRRCFMRAGGFRGEVKCEGEREGDVEDEETVGAWSLGLDWS